MSHRNTSSFNAARSLEFTANFDKFKRWLIAYGAVILAPASQWEVLRYEIAEEGHRARNVSIVYKNSGGMITLTRFALTHYSLYVAKRPGPSQVAFLRSGKKPSTRAKKQEARAKIRALLRDRDGDDCWFCGMAMYGLGEDGTLWDASIEHKNAKHLGGGNDLENLVLAHLKCNRDAGHLPLEFKEIVRQQLRSNSRVSNVPHWGTNNTPPISKADEGLIRTLSRKVTR